MNHGCASMLAGVLMAIFVRQVRNIVGPCLIFSLECALVLGKDIMVLLSASIIEVRYESIGLVFILLRGCVLILTW